LTKTLLREKVHNGALALAARTMRKFSTPLGGDGIDILGNSLAGLL
jgi:hypothetical protein